MELFLKKQQRDLAKRKGIVFILTKDIKLLGKYNLNSKQCKFAKRKNPRIQEERNTVIRNKKFPR